MNIKILTCLLVAVAYSEAGTIPSFNFADDFLKYKAVNDSEEATLSPPGGEMTDGSDAPRFPPPPPPPSRNPPPPLRLTLDNSRQGRIITAVAGDLIPFIVDCVRHLNAKHQGLAVPRKVSYFTPKMKKELQYQAQFLQVDTPLPLFPDKLHPEYLQSMGTLSQRVKELFIPLIGHIAKSLMTHPRPWTSPMRSMQMKGSNRQSEGAVKRTFEEFESSGDYKRENLYEKIAAFVEGKIIYGIMNVVEKVTFKESSLPLPPKYAYLETKQVKDYIEEEIVPAYVAVVRQLLPQNEDASHNDDAHRPEGANDNRDGREPERRSFRKYLKGNMFAPIFQFLWVDERDIKMDAIKYTEVKMRVEEEYIIEKVIGSSSREAEKKYLSQLRDLHDQWDLLKLETAEEEEARRIQDRILHKIEEQVIKHKMDLFGRLSEEVRTVKRIKMQG